MFKDLKNKLIRGLSSKLPKLKGHLKICVSDPNFVLLIHQQFKFSVFRSGCFRILIWETRHGMLISPGEPFRQRFMWIVISCSCAEHLELFVLFSHVVLVTLLQRLSAFLLIGYGQDNCSTKFEVGNVNSTQWCHDFSPGGTRKWDRKVSHT